MSKDNITIHVGGLAKPLIEQVAEQGYRFKDARDCAVFENHIEQVTRLMFAFLITKTEANRIFGRITKAIGRAVKKVET